MTLEEEIKAAAYNPVQEHILQIIEKTLSNDSHNYFRIVISFYLTQIASSMRAFINGKLYKNIPINMYACTLMTSGGGKGRCQSLIQRSVTDQFRKRFQTYILPSYAQHNLEKIADEKSVVCNDKAPEDILKEVVQNYESLGSFPFDFDSATGPAFKQVRAKAQMAGIGALNFICDEIGSNIINSEEFLNIGLEVFDEGFTKEKLTKDSSANKRVESRDEGVPTNMLWFGTPSKLLNGGKEEDMFYSLLDAGFARRLFYGEGDEVAIKYKTGKEMRDAILAEQPDDVLKAISDQLVALCNISNVNQEIFMDAPEEELICDYQIWCNQRAEIIKKETGGINEEIRLAELKNRHFKALKLAGAYAFIDGMTVISKDHLLQAIKLTEDSGDSFLRIMHRDPNYVRLAKYVSSRNKVYNWADLSEALPFFKGSEAQKRDLINLATAWAYNNSIVIKSFERNNIEFVQGQKLEETNLNEIVFSSSQDIADHYENAIKPFDKLERMGQVDGFHWCTHHFMPNVARPDLGNHRSKEYVMPAFNLLVLDIDENCTIDSAKDILKDYKYIMYTTKRHTADANRFRIILPMKYKLYLNEDDYRQFMINIMDSLPFTIDEKCKDIARSWLTNNGTVFVGSGSELFDPRPYIPESAQDKERKLEKKKYGNLDNIARWFVKQIKPGNRNHMLYRYGIMLKDMGLEMDEIKTKVKNLNSRVDAPLSIDELDNTIFSSIA